MKQYVSPVSYNSSGGVRTLIPALVAAAELGLLVAGATAGAKAGKKIVSAVFGVNQFKEDYFKLSNFKVEDYA